jgi:transcriptional regulator with XRE-family HTH domain
MEKKQMQEVLKEIGWSQAYLAELLGIHPTTVSRWEIVPSGTAAFLELHLRVKRALEVK